MHPGAAGRPVGTQFETTPFTYRMEEDWSEDRRVLAASFVHDHPPGAVEPGADPAAPLEAVQDQFLHAYAPAVRLNGLVALAPVFPTKADDVTLDDLDVALEAWSVAGLEFLEVSIRVKPKARGDAAKFTARAERK